MRQPIYKNETTDLQNETTDLQKWDFRQFMDKAYFHHFSGLRLEKLP